MELYLRKLSPKVKTNSYGVVPVWFVYLEVQQLLNTNTDNPLVAKYRKQVLGDSVLSSAPDEYWEIGLINELRITPDQWRSFSLDDQAKIMARHYLSNMVATVDAHYRAREENIRKNQGGGSSNG